MELIGFYNHIAVNYIEAFLMISYFVLITRKFISHKIFFKEAAIFTVLFGTFTILIQIFFTRYDIAIIFTLLIIFLSIMYRKDFIEIIISASIIFVSSFLIEFTMILIFSYIFRTNLSSISKNELYCFIILGTSFVIKSVLLIVVHRNKTRISNILKNGNAFNFPFLALVQGILLTGITVSTLIIVTENDVAYIVKLLITILFLLYIIFSFISNRDRDELSKAKGLFKLQEQYVKNLELVIDAIRKEKHDYSNHINTLLAMCLMKDSISIDKIESYAKKFLNKTGGEFNFYKTGNSYIDGLLAVKSNYAMEHNITLEVDLDAPLCCVDIDDTDLISILGNIIDNAFDAINLLPPEKQGIVSIHSFIDGEKFLISISNNGPKIPENIQEKIFQKKFSSKSSNRNDRGFGLYIVEQLVNRNKGKITVYSTEEYTEFLIELSVKNDSCDFASEAM